MAGTETKQEMPGSAAPDGAALKEQLISKDYILLMFAGYCSTYFNFASVAVLSPLMILLTGRAVLGGVMLSAYAFAAIVARPVLGVISDKIGRMKLLFAGAMLLVVTAFAFGMTTSIALMIVLRILGGIGYGTHSTCLGAAVADVLPKSRFAEGIGYFGLSTTLSQMMAPAIAIAIISGGELIDFRTVFMVMTLLCFAGMVAGACVSYERKRRRIRQAGARGTHEAERQTDQADQATEQAAETDQATEQAALAEPRADHPTAPAEKLPKTFLGFEYAVLAPSATAIFFVMGYAGVLSFITVFANARGFGNAGLVFTFSSVGTLLARLIGGRIVDRYNADVVVIPAISLMIFNLIMLTVVQTTFLFLAVAVLIGIAHGIVLPSVNAILFKRCSPKRRGTASAAFYSAIDLGVALGSPILGAIADVADYNILYYAASAFCAIALVIYVFLASDKRYAAKARI